MSDHDQTLIHRRAEDDRAALRAFERLYLYAGHSGNPVLAALAVLKALQKLQNAADRASERNADATVELPAWVRDGIWPTLRTLMKPPKGGELGFIREAKSMRQGYLRWAKVQIHMAQNSVNQAAAVAALGGIHADAYQKAFTRAQGSFKEDLMQANQLDFRDENGRPLQPVEARDLVPTQQISKLIQMIG
jgi:hypothetical protein